MSLEELQGEVLPPEATEFLIALHEKFDCIRKHLVMKRRTLLHEFSERAPTFLEATQSIRKSQWTAAEAPQDLLDRRVEITGPADAKMIINALNSGARVFMADFEDSLSPSFENLLNGQAALKKAIRRTLSFRGENGKEYKLNPQIATLMARPRGLHLEEEHFKVRGQATSGSLFDFGLYLFHNAHELLQRNSGPYFYLPKLENHEEASWWNDVFNFSEERLKLPKNCIRATVLIETITAAFEMDEIIYALKNHIVGLNAGRWDYIFSLIKNFHTKKSFLLSDRSELSMTTPFMEAYCTLLVQTCHRRGIHAMGGMSAFVPNRNDPELNERAIAKVIADKKREAQMGFDGTWVAHPDLVQYANAEFTRVLGLSPHQKHSMPDGGVKAEALLDIPKEVHITEEGIRTNISVCLRYLDRWLSGVGAAAIDNLMEDVATAEISRSQLWQWLHHNAKLADGRDFTFGLYKVLLQEIITELDKRPFPHLHQAIMLLNTLVLDEKFHDFLTLKAYRILIKAELKEREMSFNKETYCHRMEAQWTTDERWKGVHRNYSPRDVIRLRGSVPVKYSLAELGAQKLWSQLNESTYMNTFGAMTGSQAVQMVKAGLQSIYVSGWQVAADANLSGQTYPDQSLYPSNSVPHLVRRINNAFTRADQISNQTGKDVLGDDWYAPIIADAEAGFGGPLHAFELMKAMIEAGAAGVHFEDQLAAEKKCGHLAGKVLIPTSNFIRTLQAARLAADVMDVPTVIVARTDALSATLMTSDIDPTDRTFLTGERTPEGYFHIHGGLDYAINRALAYSPWADVLWFETSKPDMKEAEKFAKAVHKQFPGKILAYNCSPSFNWKLHLSDAEIAEFQDRLGKLGYKFQFITLAGWHLLNYHTFDLAHRYAHEGMSAYVGLQEQEFRAADKGYTAVKHQAEVGTGYFDQVLQIITEGQASTEALSGSTEEQFQSQRPQPKPMTTQARH